MKTPEEIAEEIADWMLGGPPPLSDGVTWYELRARIAAAIRAARNEALEEARVKLRKRADDWFEYGGTEKGGYEATARGQVYAAAAELVHDAKD